MKYGDFLVTPGEIFFEDYPDFKPNLTPRQIFLLGSFGGTYWRPIFSTVSGEDLRNQHLEFECWWDGIPGNHLTSIDYYKSINRYRVKSGTDLELWESKGWIHEQDPYGWVQWYCRFFAGRRSEDDARQVTRWKSFTGFNGRFRRQLITRILEKESNFDDESISPVIRQSLQHWAYQLTETDFENDVLSRVRKNFG
ncbi:MAG: hypothetical protein QF440_05245 [Candidatus Thalassarchaeaceae archaeon]|jgi:hypothetical protein|nr:hypothetical protein [Candidatus Thalassarchaeaceae archaeon]